jgi:hypothetical protein
LAHVRPVCAFRPQPCTFAPSPGQRGGPARKPGLASFRGSSHEWCRYAKPRTKHHRRRRTRALRQMPALPEREADLTTAAGEKVCARCATPSEIANGSAA